MAVRAIVRRAVSANWCGARPAETRSVAAVPGPSCASQAAVSGAAPSTKSAKLQLVVAPGSQLASAGSGRTSQLPCCTGAT